jgi:hypothetical protein
LDDGLGALSCLVTSAYPNCLGQIWRAIPIREPLFMGTRLALLPSVAPEERVTAQNKCGTFATLRMMWVIESMCRTLPAGPLDCDDVDGGTQCLAARACGGV